MTHKDKGLSFSLWYVFESDSVSRQTKPILTRMSIYIYISLDGRNSLLSGS
jgi:hypothetical protein